MKYIDREKCWFISFTRRKKSIEKINIFSRKKINFLNENDGFNFLLVGIRNATLVLCDYPQAFDQEYRRTSMTEKNN